MRISDWSSDVCSSDLAGGRLAGRLVDHVPPPARTPARDPRRTRLDRTGSRRSGNPDSVGATDHDPRDLGRFARQVINRSDRVVLQVLAARLSVRALRYGSDDLWLAARRDLPAVTGRQRRRRSVVEAATEAICN